MTDETTEPINTHHMVCDFGRHNGKLWTRVPVSYLLWMVNQPGGHTRAEIARAELKRRGTVTPTIEVSGHAIDRASLQCRKIWHETRGPDEGIHAWLCRLSVEALESGQVRGEKMLWKGMRFVFEFGGEWPVLKTIMRGGKNDGRTCEEGEGNGSADVREDAPHDG